MKSAAATVLLLMHTVLSLSLPADAIDNNENGAAGRTNIRRNLGAESTADGVKPPPRHRKRLFRRKKKSLASVLFPGVAPEEYEEGQDMTIYAELVESRKTQVPFKFYDLPGCEGPPVGKKLRKNLGAKLQGYDSLPSPYDLKALTNSGCKTVCISKLTPKDIIRMHKLISLYYRTHLVLDGLPVVMQNKQKNYVIRGYPVGFHAVAADTGMKDDQFYLYNHLRFAVHYHEDPETFEGLRVVGFSVIPVSKKHEFDIEKIKTGSRDVSTCKPEDSVLNNAKTYLPLDTGNGKTGIDVMYSYEVSWVQTDTVWADRWDIYLSGAIDEDVHLFSVVNSFMIVLFLGGVIAAVLLRTLKKDIALYNNLSDMDEEEGESGWKLVHADVFRPPQMFPMLLSVAVGTGAQIGSSVLISIVCCLMGIFNHMDKGQTLTTIIMVYVLTGTISGYISSRLYKFFQAKDWKENTILTAAAFPGVLVSFFTVLNIFLSVAGAATAASFTTIIAIFLLWICVSTPLVFVGSYFGYRADPIEVPTKTNQIARFIPETPWHTTLPWSLVLGGMLPFASICIELFFILGAIWLRHIYYLIGFLLVVMLILSVSCSEISVIMCYSQLISEDYKWWWKSFLNAASTGGYCFLYALWFLSTKLDLVGVLPVMVYLTYMGMVCLAISLFCGSLGFLTSFFFTIKIYGAIKVD